MSGPPAIGPDTTIREAVARYPQTAAVFARHGLAGCGGSAGLAEPIEQFARLHHVDVASLLRELRESARQPAAAPALPPAAAWEPYRLYLKTSLLLALTAGFGLGVIAVLSRVGGPSPGTYLLPWIQVHGQVQLLGWVGLFVVGVAYHVVPRFRGLAPVARCTAAATYALLVGAVLVRAAGQTLAVSAALAGAYTLAALLQLAASGLFAATLLRWLVPRPRDWEGYEPYLLAAAGWLVLAGLLAVAIAVPADRAGRAVVASPLSAAYLAAMFYGFALMAALGVTRRAIPLFMGLRPTNTRLALAAFATLNAAVALAVGGRLCSALDPAGPGPTVAGIGVVLALLGAIAFVLALRLYERAPMPPGPGQPRGHEPYVRSAYGWLLFSLGLGVVQAWQQVVQGVAPSNGMLAAERHALALGFISLLIFGVASRVVPVFGGVALWRRGLLAPLYVTFNAGVVLRVVGELLGSADSPGRGLVALSGLLAYGGLGLFALMLWRTLDSRPVVALPLVAARPSPPGDAPALDLTVADVLARWPATLSVFLAHGFAPLANPGLRAALAPRVTVAQAARMRGRDPAALLADLRAAAEQQSPSRS